LEVRDPVTYVVGGVVGERFEVEEGEPSTGLGAEALVVGEFAVVEDAGALDVDAHGDDGDAGFHEVANPVRGVPVGFGVAVAGDVVEDQEAGGAVLDDGFDRLGEL
jgi:hypothetical protein